MKYFLWNHWMNLRRFSYQNAWFVDNSQRYSLKNSEDIFKILEAMQVSLKWCVMKNTWEFWEFLFYESFEESGLKFLHILNANKHLKIHKSSLVKFQEKRHRMGNVLNLFFLDGSNFFLWNTFGKVLPIFVTNDKAIITLILSNHCSRTLTIRISE